MRLPPLRRRAVLAGLGAASIAGRRPALAAPAPVKVILDTDPGIDDAMALLFLHHSPGIDLLGITSSAGNGAIETTTRNALYLCERFGIDVPVARGAALALNGIPKPPPTFVHGNNGLGDVPIPARIGRRADPRPAWRFLIDTIRAHPGDVTVIAVGHMTNLALALRHDPGIARLVKQLVIMGGAFDLHGVQGNVTPAAEANIIGDPLAADEVLGAAWPVVLVGLDVTTQTRMDDAYLRALAASAPDAGRFIWDITRFYMDFHRHALGLTSMYVNDSSAIAYVLDPSLFRVRGGPVRVVVGGIADGETIQDPGGTDGAVGAWSGRPSVTICTDVDSERFKALYARALAGH